LLYGNSYARIVRHGGNGQALGLWFWEPTQTHPDRDKAGNLVYLHKDGSEQERTYTPDQVFHFRTTFGDSMRGRSIISVAGNSFNLANVMDEYSAKWFQNGGRRPYYLKKATNWKDQTQGEKFREDWNRAYASSDGFHRAPILTGDIELHELGMPLEDAQLLAARQYSVTEICRWFGITPHLAFDLSRATFSNIEQTALEAVMYCFRFWCQRLEQAINRQLFTDGEKKSLYVKHNMAALLRGDFKSRMDGYAVGVQNGWWSIDEVRGLEDLNPIPGGFGAAYHIPAQVQTLPGTGEPTSFEKRALQEPAAAEKPAPEGKSSR
jgi:HK97 family phage portal protein